MATDPDSPSLEEREKTFQYSRQDAGTPPIQRLATALHDRYSIERLIDRGGAAYVYLARDLRDDRLVALKLLRPEFAADVAQARFRREIEIVRDLEHPNILPLYDWGAIDGLIYFTMPYVEGDTLRARLRRERQFPLTDALSITRDVAGALDYAHQHGVLHRDIKPPNILLDKGRTLVADFGIARAIKVASGEEITTHSGLAIGTPEYMSPEQGAGDRQLDQRSDIYALGCVLHEMLAGEPPFTGPTAQAIIARHCLQPPPSIRLIRPDIPLGVERAICKALAKVPADRFSTAGQFIAALEDGLTVQSESFLTRHASRVRAIVLSGLLAIAVLVAWYLFRPGNPPLDFNRVVVFPLRDQAGAGDAGEAVATYVGYALDGTKPLKWLDGWELLSEDRRAQTGRIDAREARRVTRAAGAGFFIDGSIVRRPDSVTVILKLFSLTSDSVVRVAGRSAPTGSASPPQLGVAAVADLLPALVAPGGRIDLSAFGARRPAAIANFLQGEREYRRMQFAQALDHYKSALEEDSAFVLAASRGSYAANWLSEFDEGTRLADIALRDPRSLSVAQLLLTRGLRAYLTGSADSAVSFLRQALQRDSLIHAGWTVLGEVYSRLLPDVWSADSLARDALFRARRIDPDFAPSLLLLEENALRNGNIAGALLLRGELQRAGADTTHEFSRRLMLSCIRDGPTAVDWARALRKSELDVLSSGKILGGHAAQPGCAIGFFSAVVTGDSVSRSGRWAGFVGLQAQLAAVQRSSQAAKMFERRELAGLPIKLMYPLLAAAGAGFDAEARKVADSVAAHYERSSAPALWHFATWEASRKNAERVRKIAQVLSHKADSSGSRRDRLIRDAIAARLRLLEGDSVAALAMLRALTPSAPRQQITYDAWESLGPERLQLAQLLYARGLFAEAYGVATELDATEPLTYPLYLRASIALRLHIAEIWKNAKLTAEYRRRMSALNWSG